MAAFTFSGIASGLDTASIVSALVNVERAPIRRYESEQKTLESRQSKYGKMRDMLNELKSASEDLNDRNAILTGKATSSEETAFTLDVSGGTPLGTYDVSITREATSERTYSAGFANKSATGQFGTGTLSITVGGDAQVDIPVDGNTTLESLVNDINNSAADVTAGLVFDGTDYRIMVNGNRTGATDGAITFAESGTSIGLYDVTDANQYRKAESAVFSIDGLPSRTSETNTITDAIPGATINILGATTGTQKATFEADNTSLMEKLDKFVEKFNSTYSKINYELTNRGDTGGSSASDTLNGDSVLRTVQQRLSRALTSSASGSTGTYSTLAELGLSIDRSGTMSLNKTKFEEALAKDPDSVAKVLIEDKNNGSVGVLANLANTIDGLTNTTDGLISNRMDGIDDRVRDLDDQIARMELHIDSYEAHLNQQFTSLETTMSGLQAQQSQLIAMMGGLVTG